ncbi:hypothetical protein C8J57DRAFT_1493869 [Mycena rebaudengoi]|nr:hypothetical protein C8J57DRAFT_1493869 [Mycena rebaudengoi]
MNSFKPRHTGAEGASSTQWATAASEKGERRRQEPRAAAAQRSLLEPRKKAPALAGKGPAPAEKASASEKEGSGGIFPQHAADAAIDTTSGNPMCAALHLVYPPDKDRRVGFVCHPATYRLYGAGLNTSKVSVRPKRDVRRYLPPNTNAALLGDAFKMVCLFLRNRTAATPEKAVNWDIADPPYMDEFIEGAGGSSAALSSLVTPPNTSARGRSFMRVLLHFDYLYLRTAIVLKQLVFMSDHHGADFTVLFDYTTGWPNFYIRREDPAAADARRGGQQPCRAPVPDAVMRNGVNIITQFIQQDIVIEELFTLVEF